MDNGAPMQEEDLKALRNAVEALEHPGLAARLSNLFGKPIEMIRGALPFTICVTGPLPMTSTWVSGMFSLLPAYLIRLAKPAALPGRP